jgi:multiple sugar transport system substrate-binding protein
MNLVANPKRRLRPAKKEHHLSIQHSRIAALRRIAVITKFREIPVRGVIAGLLVAGMLGFVLFAGSPIGGGNRVTVRFWNGFTGPDGRTILALVKRFNRENPDVRVLMQRLDWAPYYSKLFVAGLGGRAPEVFVVHAANIARFMQGDFVRPVDDRMGGEAGLDPSDFYQNVWGAVEHEGRHYGVPLDVHPVGMYYNKALFREAGVVDAEGNARPPKTREEFLGAARKIAALPVLENGRRRWGFVFTWFRTNVYTIMRQYGGEFFTEDGERCVLDNAENVAALEFCADLVLKEQVAPSPENFDAWIGFLQGRVGMVFEGIYMLADLKKQTDLDWGAAPVPRLGSKPAAWADSHVLCLRSDLSEEELEASWRFIRFLSDNSLDWAEGGQVPVRKSLRETERFRSMTAPYEFSRQIPYVVYLPQVPFIFEFEAEFDLAVEKALRGSASAREALEEATRNVNETLDRRRAMLAGAKE